MRWDSAGGRGMRSAGAQDSRVLPRRFEAPASLAAIGASLPTLALPSWEQAPALIPAVCAWVGSAMGTGSRSLSILPWLTLLFLALTLRGRFGYSLAALAAGFILAGAYGSDPLSLPELDRPVKVTARITRAWIWEGGGWSGKGRSLLWQQDLRVRTFDSPIRLYLPPESTPPDPGSITRIRGYMTRSSGYANQPRVQGGGWRVRAKSDRFLEVLEAPPLVWSLGSYVRSKVDDRLYQRSNSRAAGLARALLLGDSREMTERSRQGLRRWGLAHLTAVSGLHLALAIAPIWWILPASKRRFRVVLSVSVVIVYLLLVGPRPSLLRASVMAIFVLLGVWCRRPFAALQGLGLAVLLLLAIDPAIARDLGFCLSVSATAGLLALAPSLAARWVERGPSWIPRRNLAACAAAWLATLPWVAVGFHVIVPASPLLNLIFVPWVGIVLPLLAFWVAVDLLCPAIASWLTPLLEVVVEPFHWPGLLPSMPWLSESVPWGFWEAGCISAMIAIWLWRPSWPRFACVLGSLALAAAPGSAGARVAMIDVGQGDATLLNDRGGAVLVDTGGWTRPGLASRVLLPALAGLGVRRLDAVVISHGDSDHCGALPSLLDRMPVEEVWTTSEVRESKCLRLASAVGRTRIEALEAGDRRRVGGWNYLVMHPPRVHRYDENNASLVVLAEHRGTRILMTGDAGAAAERRLVDSYGEDLRAEVLKVAHHGSQTSSSRLLLESVRPRLALISAGVANRYGHPARSVLDRLSEQGIPVLRTDRSGVVLLHLSANGRMRIETPASPR